jgi:hypothetical protein
MWSSASVAGDRARRRRWGCAPVAGGRLRHQLAALFDHPSRQLVCQGLSRGWRDSVLGAEGSSAVDAYLGPVWFVAKCATLCLRLVVRIK